MKITLKPMRMDTILVAELSGDILILNGEEFDFSPLSEGALLPREAVDCKWLASDVERVGGEISLDLILPHGADAPKETLFPAPITITEDGVIALPPHDGKGQPK